MAGVPITIGRIVQYHSALGATVNPAMVVEIPSIVSGGYPNATEDGDPKVVNLLVFSTAGIFPVYNVHHKSFGTDQYWQFPEIK